MRFAINPLQWAATGDGELDWNLTPIESVLMATLSSLGLGAVHATVATREALPGYRQALGAAGIDPAPGYFSLFAAELDGEGLTKELSRAREMAKTHAALGLKEIFLADNLNPIRREIPGRGAGFDSKRLLRVSGVLEATAEVFHSEGILACLHQHVASWVETEYEFRFVLDRIDPEILGAGPDVAHLAWAGADPVLVIDSLGERVRVAHLKDLHLDILSAAGGLSYQEAVVAGVWTEPGRGDLDLEACIAALKRGSVSWVVLEVDRPDHLSPEESARRCAIWAATH